MQAPVTPYSIFQVATGFMASKHLFVATEIGLFEQIPDSGSTLDGAERAHQRASTNASDDRRCDGSASL